MSRSSFSGGPPLPALPSAPPSAPNSRPPTPPGERSPGSSRVASRLPSVPSSLPPTPGTATPSGALPLPPPPDDTEDRAHHQQQQQAARDLVQARLVRELHQHQLEQQAAEAAEAAAQIRQREQQQELAALAKMQHEQLQEQMRLQQQKQLEADLERQRLEQQQQAEQLRLQREAQAQQEERTRQAQAQQAAAQKELEFQQQQQQQMLLHQQQQAQAAMEAQRKMLQRQAAQQTLEQELAASHQHAAEQQLLLLQQQAEASYATAQQPTAAPAAVAVAAEPSPIAVPSAENIVSQPAPIAVPFDPSSSSSSSSQSASFVAQASQPIAVVEPPPPSAITTSSSSASSFSIVVVPPSPQLPPSAQPQSIAPSSSSSSSTSPVSTAVAEPIAQPLAAHVQDDSLSPASSSVLVAAAVAVASSGPSFSAQFHTLAPHHLEASIDEQLELGETPRDHAPDDDADANPFLAASLRSSHFAGGMGLTRADEAMQRMMDEIHGQGATRETPTEDEYHQEDQEEEEERALPITARSRYQAETGRSAAAPVYASMSSSSPHPNVQGISLQDQADLLHLPPRNPVEAHAHHMAAASTNTSSIISALSLRVAQLESALASRETQIHYLRQSAGDPAAPITTAMKLHAPTTATATAGKKSRQANDGSETSRRRDQEVEFDLADLEDELSASAGLIETPDEHGVVRKVYKGALEDPDSVLSLGSLGASLLSQVSPSTLSGHALRSVSGVMPLRQHHAELVDLTVKFDRALTTATRESALLKTHVEKLEAELRNVTLHADTLAIEGENYLARETALSNQILYLRSETDDQATQIRELQHDLELLEEEHGEQQLKHSVLGVKLQKSEAEQAKLQASLAEVHGLLDSMTAKRDEEAYLKNTYALKLQTLEAEYEKVERIWEQHQKELGSQAWYTGIPAQSGNQAQGQAPVGLGTRELEEGMAAVVEKELQARQDADEWRTARRGDEEKTADGGDGGATNRTVDGQVALLSPSHKLHMHPSSLLSSPTITPSIWLQQHELQHLFHKNEKRKLKKELRDMTNTAEMWKDNYETLQKLHYAMVDQFEARGLGGGSGADTVRKAGRSGGGADEEADTAGDLPGEPSVITSVMARVAKSSPLAQKARKAAADSGLLSESAARSAEVAEGLSGVDTKNAGGIHVIAPSLSEQDLAAMRGEVRRLVYFLSRTQPQRVRDAIRPLTNPLLPPMPPTLPSAHKPAWICLEETIVTLTAELEARTAEAGNLNSMLALVMEPAYKLDWSTAGIAAQAKADAMTKKTTTDAGAGAGAGEGPTEQTAVIMSGLALELQFKEEEIVALTSEVARARDAETAAETKAQLEISAARSIADTVVNQTRDECDRIVRETMEAAAARVRTAEEQATRRVTDTEQHCSKTIIATRQDAEKLVAEVRASCEATIAATISQSARALREAEEAHGARMAEKDQQVHHWSEIARAKDSDVGEEGRRQMKQMEERHAEEVKKMEGSRRALVELQAMTHTVQLEDLRAETKATVDRFETVQQARIDELNRAHALAFASQRDASDHALAALQFELAAARVTWQQREHELLARTRPSRIVQVHPIGAGGAAADEDDGTVKVRFHGTEEAAATTDASSSSSSSASSSSPAVKIFSSSTLALLAPGSCIAVLPPLETDQASLEVGWASARKDLLAAQEQLQASQTLVDTLRGQLATLTADHATAARQIGELQSALTLSKDLAMLESTESATREAQWRSELFRVSDRCYVLEHYNSRLHAVLAAEALKVSGGTVAEWRAIADWSAKHQQALASKLAELPPAGAFTGVVPPRTLVLEPFDDAPRLLLESARVALAADQTLLTSQQKDFQAYLTQQHSALDSRLADIQAAEELILAKDREILVECSLLNAKIEEYNLKAATLNQRTEELKRKRQEMKEERQVWNQYRQQGANTAAQPPPSVIGGSTASAFSTVASSLSSSAAATPATPAQSAAKVRFESPGESETSFNFSSPPTSPRQPQIQPLDKLVTTRPLVPMQAIAKQPDEEQKSY